MHNLTTCAGAVKFIFNATKYVVMLRIKLVLQHQCQHQVIGCIFWARHLQKISIWLTTKQKFFK